MNLTMRTPQGNVNNDATIHDAINNKVGRVSYNDLTKDEVNNLEVLADYFEFLLADAMMSIYGGTEPIRYIRVEISLVLDTTIQVDFYHYCIPGISRAQYNNDSRISIHADLIKDICIDQLLQFDYHLDTRTVEYIDRVASNNKPYFDSVKLTKMM